MLLFVILLILQIARCDACQRYEKIKTVAPNLTPIKIIEPMNMVGMDLIGRSCYIILTCQHQHIRVDNIITKHIRVDNIITKHIKLITL